MHSMIRRISSCAVICVFSLAAQAGPTANLLPASAPDQVVRQLSTTATQSGSRASLERAPANFSWALDPQQALDPRPQPHVDESREFWRNVSGAELQSGMRIVTSAPGALLRFSPHARSRATLDIGALQVQSDNGHFDAGEAFRNQADAQQLHAAGMAVPGGSHVLQLDDAVGSGDISIIARDAQGDWLVHVYEPRSTVVLTLRADRDTVLAGDQIRIHADMEGKARLQSLGGLLTSPTGFSQPFDFTAQKDGSFAAVVRADPRHVGGQGLWEVHAFGHGESDGRQIARDARTAVAVSVAGARLSNRWQLVSQAARQQGVAMTLDLDVALASRYQLAGVLWGSDQNGKLKPAAIAHAAAWLEPGNRQITLRFDQDALSPSGLTAPYELRDLRLIDQDGMSLLERRERALVLD